MKKVLMRQIYNVLVGVAILLGGMFLFNLMGNSKVEPEKKADKSVKSVYVKKASNSDVPVTILTSGSLLAKDRMVIFSEVTGVFIPPSKPFKTGTSYRRGEALIRVNNEEFRASVVSQRSAFKNLIISIIPDIKFDYPESISKWQNYFKSIDIQKSLPSLPESDNDKEASFMTGKNISSTFYTIKNLETRLSKYTITAPYTGVLTEASITPGSIVSPGQKLGEFIKPNVYEVELNVNSSFQDFLKVGKSVNLAKIDGSEVVTGKVVRVNPQINRASQTIKIFVELVSKTLKEGEYLEAKIEANPIENAVEISRSLLNADNTVYIVQDSTLVAKPVNIIYSNLNSVIVKGLVDGEQYVSKPIPSAYSGMTVKIIQ
ncbi:MAG: efflux RND transporter periplasmic adaptor subunit [Crocinitomicaceae bacterium]